jgi:tetratricopeptide (TPR) repeat protein
LTFGRFLHAGRGRAARIPSAPETRRGIALSIAIAGIVFWLGYDGGSYNVPSWAAAGIVVWWAIVTGIALGIWPRQPLRASGIWTIALLTVFATFTGLSAFWASGAEQPFQELDRGLLYVGVAGLVCAACSQGSADRLADGIAIGLVGIAALALLSRLFPGTFPTGAIPSFLPDAATRLSYPVNYWNGLAILVALACPLLLRTAVSARSVLVRGLALAPFPIIAAVVYLASSRSGAATFVIGLTGFFVLTGRRWAAAGACGLALVASVATVVYLSGLHELVNGPLDGASAAAQGKQAAVVLALIAALTAGMHTFLSRRLATFEPSRRTNRIAAGALAVAILASLVAANPVERLRSFAQPPSAIAKSAYIEHHFLSTNGTWRWQYWQSAFDEFLTKPLFGRGADAFEGWWAQHGQAVGFVSNAHSLYLETLGDLGLFGLGLLLGGFGVGVISGVRRTRRARPELRDTGAAVVAGFVAYAIATGVDWMWELPVVSIVGFALLGLAVGPATAQREPAHVQGEPPPAYSRGRVHATLARSRRGRRYRLALRFAAAIFCVAVLAAEIDLYAVNEKITQSQNAVALGDFAGARMAAEEAHTIEPWAANPLLQLALIEERLGRLRLANNWIRQALARESGDWRIWLVAARIETKTGNIDAASRSLARVRSLNPRSPIFATSG